MVFIKKTLACLLLAGVLVLACCSSTAQAQGQKQFNSVFMAMLSLPDLQIVQQTYIAMMKTGVLQGNDAFQQILNLAMNQTANATFFWPRDTAWADLSQQLCMSVPQIQNVMVSFPPIAASFMSLIVVPGRTLFERDFKNGEKLPTLNSTFTLPLTLQTAPNGFPKWMFPGLAFNRSDVTIVNYDVRAGNAVIHFVDTAFLDESQRSFWSVQRDLACAKASPVITTNVTGPGGRTQTGLSPGIIAAIVVICIVAVAALLAVAFMYMQHAKLRRLRKQQQQQQQQQPLDGEAADGLGAAMFRPELGPQHGRPFTSDSANSGHALSDAAERGELDQDQQQLLPAFEPKPVVSPENLDGWLQLQQGKQPWGGAAAAAAGVAAGAAGGAAVGCGGDGSSSSSSGATLRFAEQLARDLDPMDGNPNIKNNMTNFVRKSLHSRTAVYFADGRVNPKKYAVKFYDDPQACAAERDAYRDLQGAQNKHIPLLETAYVEPPGSGFTSFCVFEQGSKCLDDFAQQHPNVYKLIDVFHQLLSAVQYLHERGRVHLDMKPQNVVYMDRAGLWMLIDLATSARIGEETRLVYTRDYCSPEVAQAAMEGRASFVAQPATDMWGVGLIMYQLVTGRPFFLPSWGEDGRLWRALAGFERLPSELQDITTMPGVDPNFKGIMRQVRRLLQRRPEDRPSAQVLLMDRLFQARNTTTQVSHDSSTFSVASAGSSAAAAAAAPAAIPYAPASPP